MYIYYVGVQLFPLQGIYRNRWFDCYKHYIVVKCPAWEALCWSINFCIFWKFFWHFMKMLYFHSINDIFIVWKLVLNVKVDKYKNNILLCSDLITNGFSCWMKLNHLINIVYMKIAVGQQSYLYPLCFNWYGRYIYNS